MLPAPTKKKSFSSKRQSEDAEEPSKAAKKPCGGVADVCEASCQLNAGGLREFCLDHCEPLVVSTGKRENDLSEDTAKATKNPRGGLVAWLLCAASCMLNAGRPLEMCSEHCFNEGPPVVLRDKKGNALCPPGCPKVGQQANRCRTHGGSRLCPIDCKDNKTKSMQRKSCPVHMSDSDRKPKKPPVQKRCPQECPRAGQTVSLCREHGGGGLCPTSCTTNKSITMRKVFCYKHGGSALCDESCENKGKHKMYCKLGCGGEGYCKEPCPNAEKSKELCSHGCGGWKLCDNCKNTIVKKKGDWCNSCDPVAYYNARQREAQMAAKLNSWSENKLIPAYTTWNNRNPMADALVCGTFRADFLYEWPLGVLILEFDEGQHDYYDQRCELVRMYQMAHGYGGRPVAFIRYNPDAFKVLGKTKRTTKKDRESVLLELLKACINKEDFSHFISVHYVCYDNAANTNLVQTFKFTDAAAYEAWVEAP